MEVNDIIVVAALVAAGWVFTRSDSDPRPTGEQSSVWGQRADLISDEFDEATRNEERYVGVPVSPYQ